jgi:hypothetical protein
MIISTLLLLASISVAEYPESDTLCIETTVEPPLAWFVFPTDDEGVPELPIHIGGGETPNLCFCLPGEGWYILVIANWEQDLHRFYFPVGDPVSPFPGFERIKELWEEEEYE